MTPDSPRASAGSRLRLLSAIALTQGVVTSVSGIAAGQVLEDLTGTSGELLTGAEQTVALLLGGLAAVVLSVLGDRRGRKPLLIATMLLSGSLSIATALSRDLVTYSVLQMLLRAIGLAQLVALVVLVAESSEEKRGLNTSLILGAAAAGLPLAGLMHKLLSGGPLDWRAVPLLAAVQIPMAVLVATRLNESSPWTDWRSTGAKRTKLLPRMFARGYRIQLIQVGLVLLLSHMAIFAALTTWLFHLTEEMDVSMSQGWLLIGLAAAGLLGYPFAGSLSDAYGRRKTETLFAGLAIGAISVMFSTDLLWTRAAATFLTVFCTGGLNAVLLCHSAELFPTDSRMASFAMARGLFASIGGVLGPLGAALLIHPDVALVSEITEAGWLVSMVLVPAVFLVWTLPDTAGRPLESIAASVTIPDPEPTAAYPPLSETGIVEDLFRPYDQ